MCRVHRKWGEDNKRVAENGRKKPVEGQSEDGKNIKYILEAV